jgi:TonB family protein
MTMTFTFGGGPGTSASATASSFGAASAIVIAGVLAAWVFVKRDTALAPEAVVDRETTVVAPASAQRSPPAGRAVTNSLLEQAEIAFAAGRIIEPEFDNALNYYRTLLETDPNNTDAAQGVDRVVAYLENQAEGAIFQNDWDAARAYAAVILNVRPDDPKGRELRTQANRLERVHTLTATALNQFSRGNLVAPKGDNAAESYRAILALDPDNAVAARGLRSTVQRLIANAQSAAFAGEQDKAQKFVAEARAIDPDAQGLAEIERVSKQTKRTIEDRGIQGDLLAASQALQADRLMPPASPNAFDLFSGVLARDPQSTAARQGIELVRDALLDRANAMIEAGSLDAVAPLLAQAKTAGADPQRIADVQRESKYQNRLKDAREGRFDRIYSVSELNVTRQVAPAYPRGARAKGTQGWVEVEFTVTEQGDVRDAKARNSSSSVFEGAAISAINRWRFTPVVDDGRPVPVRGVVRFSFVGDAG